MTRRVQVNWLLRALVIGVSAVGMYALGFFLGFVFGAAVAPLVAVLGLLVGMIVVSATHGWNIWWLQ